MKKTKAYQQVKDIITQRVLDGTYHDKLPNERQLSDDLKVNRGTIKKAIDILVHENLLINRHGSGNYINQFFKANFETLKTQLKGRIGLSNVYDDSHKITSKILKFNVIKADQTMQDRLLLNHDEFVYEIERVRFLDSEPLSIELTYIPIKMLPNLTNECLYFSLYKHISDETNLELSNSYLSILIDKSNDVDQELLQLQPHDPIVIIEENVILNTGSVILYSKIRQRHDKFTFHSVYKYNN